jgi:hypothetical protein
VSDEVEVMEEEEEVDWLPVLVDVRELELERVPVVSHGAVQAAAAAATGFVAGAATLALARRYGSRRVQRLQGGGILPARGTRTYIVRVHVLRPPWE